jgi:hypothetical protein
MMTFLLSGELEIGDTELVDWVEVVSAVGLRGVTISPDVLGSSMSLATARLKSDATVRTERDALTTWN